MSDSNRVILNYSWKKCEEVIVSIAEKKFDKPKFSETETRILEFLRSIHFVDSTDSSLTEKGRDYYTLKYIQEESNKAQKILTEQVKQHPATQAICQLLWGKSNIKSVNIYNLLNFHHFIDPKNLEQEDLGGFLMLLNRCDIIKYSKQTHTVTITYNPQGDEYSPPKEKFLSPDTPYSNVKHLREILRVFAGRILWIDKHFGAKGLEPLADEADGGKISEIRILAGPDNINERMKKDFDRFNQEMQHRGISVEMRVICDKEILNKIHGRWIMSDSLCYKVPPVNSIFQGQYDEMSRSENRPPFEEWWREGLPLLENYEQIVRPVK